MSADGESSSAFWVAIITAIGLGLNQLLTNYLQWKSQRKMSLMDAKLTENTQLTQATRKEVNGRVDQLVAITKENAHREGFEAGKQAAKETP